MSTHARIIIKHSASKCNKDILSFLHKNADSIKKRYKISVVLVYKDLIPKLKNKIDKLPALVHNGRLITGKSDIKKFLIPPTEKGPRDMGVCDLEDYWHNEMHSSLDGDTVDDDGTADIMDGVKKRALDQSMQHRESSKPRKKKKDVVVSNSREDNVPIDNTRISDMVGNDQMMQKFWQNQETTPGF